MKIGDIVKVYGRIGIVVEISEYDTVLVSISSRKMWAHKTICEIICK